jgi:flagellar hook-associated protein 3 FlgL
VLRADLNDLDKLVDTNELVAGHLDVTQERLSTLLETASSFQKDLLASRNSANGGNIIAQPAAANLQSLLATLNVTMDGQHLFAGINTAVQPMTDYAPGSANKTAIDAAFFAAFGFAQNSPLVSSITAEPF